MKIRQIIRSSVAGLALTIAFGVSTTPAFGHEGEDHKKGAPHATSGVPKDYPLKKCVVSDDKLGEHGKPVKVTAPDGTDVYLCCKDCKKDFDKDPAKFAKMVKAAKGKK
jgi:hypothetical protein